MDTLWERNHSPIGITTILDTVNWTYDQDINFSILQVNATDIFGNNASENFTENQVFFQYTCCQEDWVQDAVSCRTNNTHIITYTDAHSCGTVNDLPANNGTEDSCNYCSEDLQQNIGECQLGNFQNVSWTDNNFISCCSVTNITSDCSFNFFPYNETTTQFCLFFAVVLGVTLCPEEFTFKTEEKEYCLVEIPQNVTNESFKCMSYVVTDTPAQIIQVNPEYKERSDSVLDFWRGNPESREFFEPQNGWVNVYITKKNLLPENDYFLHIGCKSAQRTLESVHPFTIGYESVEFVFFRTRWLMANAGYVIGGILLLFIILAILIILWKGVK